MALFINKKSAALSIFLATVVATAAIAASDASAIDATTAQLNGLGKKIRGQLPKIQAQQQPKNWMEAQAIMVSAWRSLLSKLPETKDQSQFFESGNHQVLFEQLQGKWGTYNSDRSAPVVNTNELELLWQAYRKEGFPPLQATTLLAAKSLPAFSHLLRDAIMGSKKARAGLQIEAGMLENEIVHQAEQSRIYEAMEKLHPGLYRRGSDSDALDIQASNAASMRKDGAEVVKNVAEKYEMPSILCTASDEFIIHFKKLYQRRAADLATFSKYGAIQRPRSRLDQSIFGPPGWKPPAQARPSIDCEWTPASALTIAGWKNDAAILRPAVALAEDPVKYNALRNKLIVDLRFYEISPEMVCKAVKTAAAERGFREEAKFLTACLDVP